MSDLRLLLRVSSSVDQTMLEAKALTPLFAYAGKTDQVEADPDVGRQPRWFVKETTRDIGPASAHPWDIAHDALREWKKDKPWGACVEAVEPDLEQTWPCKHFPGPVSPGDEQRLSARLGDAFRQLATARDGVGEAGAKVVVAHLAADCAPGQVRSPVIGAPREICARDGALLGEIVPIRIADSASRFHTSTMAQAIDHATHIGADVLSIGMGGLPSACCADAVNAAYDTGVVLVGAAGNSFGGLPTSLIVYPARFGRVIAACGVMKRDRPYYSLGGALEGNVGPASKMATALAAPVSSGEPNGTSVAAERIAAAAALWLAKNKERYPRGWILVEAARTALFGSARLPRAMDHFAQYFGRGILLADKAIDLQPAPANESMPEDEACFAFLDALTGAFGTAARDPRHRQMYSLELTQLALNSRTAREAVPEPSLLFETDPRPSRDVRRISDRARRQFLEAILDEGQSSLWLREYLQAVLGHSMTSHGRDLRPTANVPKPGERPSDGRSTRRKLVLPRPTRRRLRVFATDPGDSANLETAFVNIATIEVPWEQLKPGPIGEYVEVIDVDPASGLAYAPVDLEERSALAQDGHAPSEGNPQFHQQMVYAVAMRTIRNFELALGRRALWSERRMPRENGKFVPAPDRGFVQRLRIYPHALREQNAYYSPDRKALLFGYFDAEEDDAAEARRRRSVFTCLSHDIIAHETTHALLDGMHQRYQEPTNPEVLAFHEAFADIVAIFQHFTFPELLRHEIAALRGNLSQASMLSDLARQFGKALHNERALRQAIPKLGEDGKPTEGKVARPRDDGAASDPSKEKKPKSVREAHELGATLVAAVFEAFVAVFKRTTADLFRLASGGTGNLTPGAIHPDLVNRLAAAAVDTAQRVLTTTIRALDYMPPVDPTFGDYLRAVITADANFATDHGQCFRVALVEAFANAGIFPEDVASVSPDALLWQPPYGAVQSRRLKEFIQQLDLGSYIQKDRRAVFEKAKTNAAALHDWMSENLDVDMADSLGLDFTLLKRGKPHFEVHSVRPALRTTEEGESRMDVVVVVTQRKYVPVRSKNNEDHASVRHRTKAKIPGEGNSDMEEPTFLFRGGVTLLLDRDIGTDPIRYAIVRPIRNKGREQRIREFSYPGLYVGSHDVYGDDADDAQVERFSSLHATLRT